MSTANIKFHSEISHYGWMHKRDWTEDQIKREPQFFSCDMSFVFEAAGPITRHFLHTIGMFFRADAEKSKAIIDSRVHMLMPGWYPCIPGWHLDDIPRTRKDGQPDHINPKYKAVHIMAIIGDASKTKFAIGDFSLRDVPLNKGIIYEKWHPQINRLVKKKKLVTTEAESGQIIRFNSESFHMGCPATKPGWRWFIRMSYGSEREIKNEIRTQTQVYLTAPFQGW